MRIIAGSHGGRMLKTVDGPGYRPATAKVRGAVFSMLESRGVVWGGTRVLDLFAGSGSLGFEALSRGAPEVWFVEKAPKAAACLRENAAHLDFGERARVQEKDVATFVRTRLHQPFDVIFIDPPYGESRLLPTLKAVLRGNFLAPDGLVLAEVEEHLKPDPATADFPYLTLDTSRTYGQTRILLWHFQPGA